MVKGLKVSGSQEEAAQQIKRLYHLFIEKDCTMVEVQPPLRRSISDAPPASRSILWQRMHKDRLLRQMPNSDSTTTHRSDRSPSFNSKMLPNKIPGI